MINAPISIFLCMLSPFPQFSIRTTPELGPNTSRAPISVGPAREAAALEIGEKTMVHIVKTNRITSRFTRIMQEFQFCQSFFILTNHRGSLCEPVPMVGKNTVKRHGRCTSTPIHRRLPLGCDAGFDVAVAGNRTLRPHRQLISRQSAGSFRMLNHESKADFISALVRDPDPTAGDRRRQRLQHGARQ